MEWKSNARYNQEATEGTIFDLKGFDAKVSIHKIHGCGNRLYLSCPAFRFQSVPLNTEDFDVAVLEAKKSIKENLELLNACFGAFIDDDTENTLVRY